jgi:putative phosphoribosyl transferase
MLLENEVQIPVRGATLRGDLTVPENPLGFILFAHGSGSSRHSPRNRFVAGALNDAGFGTLLFDLLTIEEEHTDEATGEHRFNISLLAERLGLATDWMVQDPMVRDVGLGYFGSSTGAGAALVAAAQRPGRIFAIVSRGGRPDLAGPNLPNVRAATLLIVGRNDEMVIQLNREAMEQMNSEVRLALVDGATHLFKEPGTLQEAARLASDWFQCHIRKSEEPIPASLSHHCG